MEISWESVETLWREINYFIVKNEEFYVNVCLHELTETGFSIRYDVVQGHLRLYVLRIGGGESWEQPRQHPVLYHHSHGEMFRGFSITWIYFKKLHDIVSPTYGHEIISGILLQFQNDKIEQQFQWYSSLCTCHHLPFFSVSPSINLLCINFYLKFENI